MSVSGVILAAGQSSRLGRPKQLLRLDGRPIIRVTAERALASRLGEVILVTGAAAGEVATAVRDLPLVVVDNPAFAEGQSTSLRAGLAAVSPAADAVIFLLGDQPDVGPTVIDALIAEFARSRAPIVQPVYRGVPGNPVLFARSLFPALSEIRGDQGARALIRQHRDQVRRVPVSDGPPPSDIDTEADYQALLARWTEVSPR